MAGNFWQSSHYQQWILDRQEILVQRAHEHLSEEEYQKIMIFFANMIQAVGENLKLRQQVIATATVYFRRFYARNCLKCIEPLLMVPTCIFLASKVEESGLIGQSKLMTAWSTVVKGRYPYLLPPQQNQQDFPYRIGQVLEAEFFLLEQMDCCLVVFHPYRSLLQFFQQDLGQEGGNEQLLALSWKVINDSLRTDVCLLYAPFQIAIACLHIASVVLNKQENLRNWFAELTVDMEKVLEITTHILHLYELWKHFDEKKEIPDLLKRLPKANTQPSRPGSAMGTTLLNQGY